MQNHEEMTCWIANGMSAKSQE